MASVYGTLRRVLRTQLGLSTLCLNSPIIFPSNSFLFYLLFTFLFFLFSFILPLGHTNQAPYNYKLHYTHSITLYLLTIAWKSYYSLVMFKTLLKLFSLSLYIHIYIYSLVVIVRKDWDTLIEQSQQYFCCKWLLYYSISIFLHIFCWQCLVLYSFWNLAVMLQENLWILSNYSRRSPWGGIIPNSFYHLLFQKFFRHNVRMPRPNIRSVPTVSL